VAMDAAGNSVVVWQSLAPDDNGYVIYGQRYNALGVAQGGEFRVNSGTTTHGRSATVAMDANGNFVVTWYGQGPGEESNVGVFARRYDSAGAALGSEFLVNTTTSGWQWGATVAINSSGFVVVWFGEGPGGDAGIFGQRFDSAGQRVGS